MELSAWQKRNYTGRSPEEINRINREHVTCRTLSPEEVAECSKVYAPPLTITEQKEKRVLNALCFSPSIARW